MAMSQSEFNRLNALDKKITELEEKLCALQKTLEQMAVKRPPGRPKRAE